MADLGKSAPGSPLVRANVSRQTHFRGKILILLCTLLVDTGGATTHWVVTEDGKIQQQVRLAELPASIAVLMTASSADTLLVMSPVTTSHPSWGGSVT